MSDAPERIWIDTISGDDGFLRVAGADLPRDEASRSVDCFIHSTASPEAFAALEPVQALIGAAYEAGADFCHGNAVGMSPRMGYILGAWEGESGSHPGMAYTPAIRALTPSDALAALAAREAAAERRAGWPGWSGRRGLRL